MIKNTRKNLFEYISRKYLDWADILPKFQGGFIYELQMIRDHQRRMSESSFVKKDKPRKAKISLKKIRIVFSFQLEEFELLQQALSKIFPNDEKIIKFVNKLKEDNTSTHTASWSDIGVIVKNTGLYLAQSKCIDTLPEHIDIVHLSYHRIMPSLACLSFTFYIEKEFSEELTEKQEISYLPDVVFKSINPFQSFRSGYSMSGYNATKKHVRGHVSALVLTLNKWLESRIKFGKQPMLPMSIIEHYELKVSNQEKEKYKWLGEHLGWLESYGISVSKNNSYRGENSFFCHTTYPNNKLPVSILTSFKNKEEKQGLYINAKLDSLSVLSAMRSTLLAMQTIIETQRKIGFQYLAKYDTKILSKSQNINSLKRIGTLLKRFQHELDEGKGFMHFSLEGAQDLKIMCHTSEQRLIKQEVENITYRLNALQKASNIIDMGLTDYFEIQNIYAMYKLQRWMFILSIVVTFATIVSLLSGWDNLIELWGKFHPA